MLAQCGRAKWKSRIEQPDGTEYHHEQVQQSGGSPWSRSKRSASPGRVMADLCSDQPHTQGRGGAAFALRLSLSFLILLSSGAIIAADTGPANFRQAELPPAMLSYVLK